MRTILAALAATMMLVPGAAQAATFLYTITGTYGQGSGGTTNVPFTMKVSVDTSAPTATDFQYAYYAATGSLTAFGSTANFTTGHLYIANGLTNDTVSFLLGTTSPTNYARLTLRLPTTAVTGIDAPTALTGYTVVTTSNQSTTAVPGLGIGMNPTISGITVQQISPVPEPASWAMMIGGFGIAGGMLRRRRKSVKEAVYA